MDVYGGLDDYSGPLYGRYCGQNVGLAMVNLFLLNLTNALFCFSLFTVLNNTETTGHNFHERGTIGSFPF